MLRRIICIVGWKQKEKNKSIVFADVQKPPKEIDCAKREEKVIYRR
jgi:hypothetical protein